MFVVKNESQVYRTELMADYIHSVKAKLGSYDGYYGASAWESMESQDEIMILVEFRQDKCGDKILEEFSQDRLAIDELGLSRSPADVTVFDLESFAGTRPADAQCGTLLSLSRRVSSPGLGEELERELDGIFGSLTLIPGYLGHVYGSHVAVSDQVLGMVLWETEESFRRSLPKNAPYRLHLYRKVL